MTMSNAWRVLILGTLLGTVASDGTAQDLPEMPSFEEVLSLQNVSGAAISPDGTVVAYVVRQADFEENRFDSEIWIASADTPAHQLTRTVEESSTSPAWSPDGRWLAFAADRGNENQVHLINPDGGEAWAVTEMEEGVRAFRWSPRNARLLISVAEPESDDVKSESEQYGAFAVEDEPGPSAHLWVLDVGADGNGGEPRRLTEGDFHVAGFEWSPVGAQVAYVRQPNSNLLSSFESDIYVLDVDTGESHAVVVGPGPDNAPTWSPDGRWILFTEAAGDLEALSYLNRELARVRPQGGEVEVLTREFDENPGTARWTDNGISFVAGHRTSRLLYSLDPESGAIDELTAPVLIIESLDVTADGDAIAFTGRSGDSLSEVYLGSRKTLAESVKLTNLTAQTQGWPLGSREVITWTSDDGAEIEGVLWKPGDYDSTQRYPLLVDIHGGPTGTSRPSLVANYVYPHVHWLAKGAVVLQPNYRGSAGYGEAFRSLNVRNLGVGDMWDVMSGVQYLIDAGIADPDRLGAMGWSQGGYISAFLTTNTDVFRAISVGAGISNWVTYYVNTDIHPFTRRYLKATPWTDPEIYALTSPMTNITQASTPTLIQHGEFDRRVPIPNAYELYQGLQDVGVETKLIVYKGFGHGINKPKEQLAAVWHNFLRPRVFVDT